MFIELNYIKQYFQKSLYYWLNKNYISLFRCNLLKSNTDMSTADYFVKFPCLTQEYAHKLVRNFENI